jgi:hypothetical protein
MASSDLTWTEAESPVNQIEEYRIFKSVSVLVADPGFADSFTLLTTLPVVRDPEFPFGEVHPLSFSDTAVDFGTDTYCYRVDAVSVLVGEATGGSPQTGVGPSNILCLGTQPSAVVLSGACVGDDVELDWTASTTALNTIAFYTICRSLNGGAFIDIATVAEPGLSFIDIGVDCVNNAIDYIVKATDEAGIVSDDSNTISFGDTEEYYITCADNLASGTRIMTSGDGSTWIPQTIDDDNYEGLAYAPDLGDPQNGRLVVLARGGDDNIKTSDDAGVSWTQRLSAAAGLSGFLSIDYSETLGLFCAISNNATSDGNKIMSSSDGINWALVPTPVGADSKSWASIRWIETYGLFLCAGVGGHSMRSADGITWIYQAVAITIHEQATNSNGRTVFSNPGDIANMYTDDGISFTHVMNPNGWNGGMLACGSQGAAFVVMAGGTQGSWTSGDAINWSGPNMEFSSQIGLMVAVGAGNGADNILTSANGGSTWAAITAPIAGSWAEVRVATRAIGGQTQQEMVLVENSASSPNVAIGFNGASFEVNALGFAFALDDVEWSSPLGLYAAVGDGVCFTSPDGITWTSRTVPANDWQGVYWDDSLALFIAVARDGSVTDNIMTSADGITWIQRTHPANWTGFVLVSNGSGRVVATGFTSGNPVGNNLFSDDGISWSTGSDPQDAINAVTYDTTRNRFVQVENIGRCNVSSDGDTWTNDINSGDIGSGNQALNSGMDYAASRDQLVWCGNAGIYSSEDGGVSWTQRNVNDCEDVKWSEALGKWIAINSAFPTLITSTDGINWINGSDPAGTNDTWVSIALGDEI